MTEVRIKHITLTRLPASWRERRNTSNPGQQVVGAWQIVDAQTGYSMNAGLWASKELAEACCRRNRWRVIATTEAAA